MRLPEAMGSGLSLIAACDSGASLVAATCDCGEDDSNGELWLAGDTEVSE